jgi:ubiquinone/menaquinone biosynthesis C-methylase UbiE
MENVIGKQGNGADEVFSGKTENETVKKLYSESAVYFASIIRNLLKPRSEPYKLLDVGAFRGELLHAILAELGEEYTFESTGIDTDTEAILSNESVKNREIGDAAIMPFEDKEFDIVLSRYVLQWNFPERQNEILRELHRVCKKFAIIQHAGAEKSDEWQDRVHKLVFGGIEKIKRPEGYFSSPEEIEQMMRDEGIKFQKLQDRILVNLSSVFIEKYKLTKEEADKVIEILGDKDSIQQTTWILYGED